MIDKVEKQKRIYQISLLLRRKPMSFILQFIAQNWGLEKRQAYNYIELARKEWEKYFAHLKGSGMSYHIAQLRDLKDQAYSRKAIIGRGDNKETVTIADLGLVFEITKEEAKLMGIYPAEKHKIEEEKKVIVIGAEEKGNAMERLFSEINKLVEKRIKLGDKHKEFIDNDGNDQRSEAQKLADRLISCRKDNQNYG
jgi:hypothetical protein